MSPVSSEVSKQLFLGLASFVISLRVFCTIATFTLAYRRIDEPILIRCSQPIAMMAFFLPGIWQLHGVTLFKQFKYPWTFHFGILKGESNLFSAATLRCGGALCTLQWLPEKLKTWIHHFYCFNLNYLYLTFMYLIVEVTLWGKYQQVYWRG